MWDKRSELRDHAISNLSLLQPWDATCVTEDARSRPKYWRDVIGQCES